MNRNILRLAFAAVALAFSLCAAALAESFYIDNYDIALNVNKNKSVAVIETLDVVFTRSSHGIIRDIPHPRGASITGIHVSAPFLASHQSDNLSLRIGDADRYISGHQRYEITYNYNYHDNENEFYHNLVGTRWNVPIYKVRFRIKMPSAINAEQAGLSIGRYGTQGFQGGAKFTIDENDSLITGETYRVLHPGEGITFRVELPPGYFNRYIAWAKYLTLFALALFTTLSCLTWRKFGKEEPVISVVNFDMPKDISVLEAEVLYSEHATRTGLAAMLIELADQGYIVIENSPKAHDAFTIKKLRTYDGNELLEEQFMSALFRGNKDTITQNELADSHSYYLECSEILRQATARKEKIYEPSSRAPGISRLMLSFIVAILYCLLLCTSNFQLAPLLEFAPSYNALVLAAMPLFLIYRGWNQHTGWGLTILTGYVMLDLISAEYLNSENGVWVLVAAICLLIVIICAINLPKRNRYGREFLGQMCGLKHYIKVAEKHQLELLASDHLEQFYRILPYAYILGVSNIWLNKIKTVIAAHPDLYEHANYNPYYVVRVVDIMKILSQPTYQNGGITRSSGGGFSGFSSGGGGGFVGGGGGGGGGSSW